MLWTNEKRAEVRAELGNLSVPEMAKELGKRQGSIHIWARVEAVKMR
jgi:hypothetical protein